MPEQQRGAIGQLCLHAAPRHGGDGLQAAFGQGRNVLLLEALCNGKRYGVV